VISEGKDRCLKRHRQESRYQGSSDRPSDERTLALGTRESLGNAIPGNPRAAIWAPSAKHRKARSLTNPSCVRRQLRGIKWAQPQPRSGSPQTPIGKREFQPAKAACAKVDRMVSGSFCRAGTGSLPRSGPGPSSPLGRERRIPHVSFGFSHLSLPGEQQASTTIYDRSSPQTRPRGATPTPVAFRRTRPEGGIPYTKPRAAKRYAERSSLCSNSQYRMPRRRLHQPISTSTNWTATFLPSGSATWR